MSLRKVCGSAASLLSLWESHCRCCCEYFPHTENFLPKSVHYLEGNSRVAPHEFNQGLTLNVGEFGLFKGQGRQAIAVSRDGRW